MASAKMSKARCTRGDHPLKAAIIGSVPHKLLQVTDRPVLVVPA